MKTFFTAEKKLREFIERHGLLLLRLSVGIIFFWFGALKFFPGNAAEALAGETLLWITAGTINKHTAVYLLGFFECLIGISILLKRYLNIIIPILYVQLCGTILPLIIFPDKTWVKPLMPSLEGQYIIKNMVLLTSGIVIGAISRGSKLITQPGVASEARQKENRITGTESKE